MNKKKALFTSLAVLALASTQAQAFADEVNPEIAEPTVTADAPVEEVVEDTEEQPATVTEEAYAEIAEKEKTPVVHEETAKEGDVISIERTDTDPVVTKSIVDGNTVTEVHRTTTIKTTSISEAGDVKGKSEPVVTVSENVTEANGITTIERVTKTTIVEYTQDSEEVSKNEVTDTDIVFLIDISGSMYDKIQGVKNNVATLVNNFGTLGLNVRLGLGTYLDESWETTKFANFKGSHFTTDVDEFISYLNNVRIIEWYAAETPTVGLYQVGTWNDWNLSDTARRFVVLLTDEGVETTRDVPSVQEAVTSLASKSIDLIVIGNDNDLDIHPLKDNAAEFLDINSNFSNLFSDHLSKTIEKIIDNTPLLKVVTDHYEFTLITIEPISTVDRKKPEVPTSLNAKFSKSPKANYSRTEKVQSKTAILPETGEGTSILGALGASLSALGLVGRKRRH